MDNKGGMFKKFIYSNLNESDQYQKWVITYMI